MIDLLALFREITETSRALARDPQGAWVEISRTPGERWLDLLSVAGVGAAIPPLTFALQMLLYQSGARLSSFLWALLLAPFAWAVLVGAVVAVAYGIFSLAPYLNARPDLQSTVKLLSWGLLPYWLCSVAGLVPYLPLLANLAGIGATCYLWFFGIPLLLDTPRNPPTTIALVGLSAGGAYALVTSLALQVLRILFL